LNAFKQIRSWNRGERFSSPLVGSLSAARPGLTYCNPTKWHPWSAGGVKAQRIRNLRAKTSCMGGGHEITTHREMEDLTSKANNPVRISLRATGAAPGERGGAVGPPEGPHEVARLPVADPPTNLLHREVGLHQ
jgi:hypothetical protein